MGRERVVPIGRALHLLGLYDAAQEDGFEARHIEACFEYELEAMRLGIPVDVCRRNLERMVGCPDCSQRWRARGLDEDGVWRAVRGDLHCSECGAEGEVL